MKINQRNYDYIDFNVIKENWCLYELEDETIVKFKFILMKIIPIDSKGNDLAFNTATVLAVLTQKGQRGNPSLPDAVLNIEKKDLPFKVLSEEWNEYKLEDGRILKMKPSIVEISKGSTYDQYGEPSYLVQSQPIIKI